MTTFSKHHLEVSYALYRFPWLLCVKNPPAMQEMWIGSLSQEDLLEKEMTTHSNMLAGEIPWTEEPDGLHFKGLQRSWTRLGTKQQQQMLYINRSAKNPLGCILEKGASFQFLSDEPQEQALIQGWRWMLWIVPSARTVIAGGFTRQRVSCRGRGVPGCFQNLDLSLLCLELNQTKPGNEEHLLHLSRCWWGPSLQSLVQSGIEPFQYENSGYVSTPVTVLSMASHLHWMPLWASQYLQILLPLRGWRSGQQSSVLPPPWLMISGN